MKINFKHSPQKIIEAMAWCLNRSGPKDILFVLKWLFYIDKFHIQKYGRPVTGDVYTHLKHGPTPNWAYNSLQGKISDPVLADTIANAFSIIEESSSRKKTVKAKRLPNMNCFSVSDTEEMERAFEFCKKVIDDNSPSADPVFNLCQETHKEKAWKKTESRQKLDFGLFIDENTPNREELLSHMREVSSWLAL
jgi:hypothetical protein